MANHTSVEVTAPRSAGHQFATLVVDGCDPFPW